MTLQLRGNSHSYTMTLNLTCVQRLPPPAQLDKALTEIEGRLGGYFQLELLVMPVLHVDLHLNSLLAS